MDANLCRLWKVLFDEIVLRSVVGKLGELEYSGYHTRFPRLTRLLGLYKTQLYVLLEVSKVLKEWSCSIQYRG
jgi:hypothetical protein